MERGGRLLLTDLSQAVPLKSVTDAVISLLIWTSRPLVPPVSIAVATVNLLPITVITFAGYCVCCETLFDALSAFHFFKFSSFTHQRSAGWLLVPLSLDRPARTSLNDLFFSRTTVATILQK
jgi:hypothetical protein